LAGGGVQLVLSSTLRYVSIFGKLFSMVAGN
jgi:hypothetical protein